MTIQLIVCQFFFYNLKIMQAIKIYYMFQFLDESEGATQQQFLYFGKIRPIWRGKFFKIPQSKKFNSFVVYMFIITLCLIISLSVLFNSVIFINGWHFWIGKILCSYILYLFVTLGFSNPGLRVLAYQQEQIKLQNTSRNLNQEQIDKDTLYCNICQIPIKLQIYHCRICDACIEGFDHHCIWVGKCIGKKNIGKFKQFLFIIFVTLIYGLILSLVMTSNVQSIKK